MKELPQEPASSLTHDALTDPNIIRSQFSPVKHLKRDGEREGGKREREWKREREGKKKEAMGGREGRREKERERGGERESLHVPYHYK